MCGDTSSALATHLGVAGFHTRQSSGGSLIAPRGREARRARRRVGISGSCKPPLGWLRRVLCSNVKQIHKVGGHGFQARSTMTRRLPDATTLRAVATVLAWSARVIALTAIVMVIAV